MKKSYTTALLVAIITFNLQLLTSNCSAQYVTIPDSNFVKWLDANTSLTGCVNGNQLDTTCYAVLHKKTINFDGYNVPIYDLTGIQYFKGLDSLIIIGHQLTNLSTLPPILEYLDCDDNALDSLPSLPIFYLWYVDCSYNPITSLPALPPSLEWLNCSGDYLFQNGLPALPANLGFLNCSGAGLTSLPALPAQLYTLYCNGNGLTSLPASLPANIEIIYCNNNQLTSLPTLPNSLSELYCNKNQLTALPALPNSLATLICNNNLLTALPALPPRIYQLNCGYNNISSLPALSLFYDLENLTCSANQISSLGTLPADLLTLECDSNLLTSLTLPTSLNYLDCAYNQLTALPPVPSLFTLYCQHNQLTALPALPKVAVLDCAYNEVSSLPPLLPVMDIVVVNNNPQLTCLPPVEDIGAGLYMFYTGVFNVTGTGITCLPNRIQHTGIAGKYLPLDTMQLCGIFNPSGCNVEWNIAGTISFNATGNCAATGLPGMGNIKVMLYDSIKANLLQQVITNGSGEFSFKTGHGKFVVDVDTTATPFTVLCPDSNYYHSHITAADSLDYNANFGLVCKKGYDLAVGGAYYTNGEFFPGINATLQISAGDLATFYGVTCHTTGLAGTVQAIFSGPVSYVGSGGILAPAKVSGDTITWSIADFSTVNFSNSFGIILNTNTSAHDGDAVCVTVTVAGSAGTDYNLSNNTLTQCFNVVTSHDPNVKEVYPSTITNPGDWLTYTIHFQNTGNAAAQNIYVLDTLDGNLDISSIQFMEESNNCLIQVLPGRILRFSFPNIFLPDSSDNKDSSVGFVQFRIKTISTIMAGTTVNNTASVYFDYNPPVITNNAASAFDVATGGKEFQVSGFKFQIYPNPTGGVVNVVLSKVGENSVVSVVDVTGRSLSNTPLNLPQGETLKSFTIDMSGLAAGVYFIRVSSASGVATGKVVKE